MGEHGMYDKRFMYEESMHIPLIMMHKATFNYPGLVNRDMVTNLDIAPTILDIAGMTNPEENVQGKSLKSTLRPGAEPVHDPNEGIFYNFYEEHGW